MPYIYKRERHDSVLPRRRTHATPSRAGFDSKNRHRLVTVTEYAILHIMSFASIATPSSYQMADEVYTVECRDIARKIEEYNTAVCKFVELGEDAEDGDAAASPKQVCVAHVVVQTIHLPRVLTTARAHRATSSRPSLINSVVLQVRQWSVSQATSRPVSASSLCTTATKA